MCIRDRLQTGLLVAVIAVLSIPLLIEVPLLDSLRQGAIVLTGMLYVGLTLSYLVLIRLMPEGEFLLIFLLLITWAADTGAYYVGTLYGRRLLAPRVSP